MDRDRRITREELKAALYEAYRRFKGNTSGKNADYIPYLANVDKDLFGISICLKDGEVLTVGDCNYRFGIESISKVATALLVLKEYGPETIIDMIGADATGMPFNSILAILLENEHPSTPLVNAGAISAVSMVCPVGNSRGKWETMVQNITELCGSEPQLINELYKSESVSNHNNRAIAWLLKGYDRIYDDPEMSLDLYTRQCSLGVTATQLSTMAATIAFGGYNPVTKRRVFPAALSEKITSMIASVGMYEYTGDWMFRTGIPAKSGVGGGIIGVLPGIFGIAAFAPPIDKAGNSVKAQLAIRYIMEELRLHIFNGERAVMVEHQPAPV
ncbi:MAG: glutaminase A [Bacteroidaceae bacterium]|nr:glutaminase A [Bacteroidaceae bacterium]